MNTGNKQQDARSRAQLKGVHPSLVRVVSDFAEGSALHKFIITDGLRTMKEQAELVTRGASHTLQSKHLLGRAIDVAVVVNGKVRWEFPLYTALAKDLLTFAAARGVPLVWGGSWKKLHDGPHFELADSVP